MKKRLLIYVHYNKDGEFAPHVAYQLGKIRELYDKILFISNSVLSDDDRATVEKLASEIIQRENVGFDFAAWRDGLTSVGWDELAKYDSVTLMNDTCFGPIHSLDAVYKKMDSQEIDFWGLINHAASNSEFGYIPEHLQSFFICFNRSATMAVAFRKFWEGVEDEQDVNQVIAKYETRMTDLLKKSGLKYEAFFNTNGSKRKFQNYTIYYPKLLLKSGFPLVKVKAFLVGKKSGKSLRGYVTKKTDYPVKYIEEYFDRYKLPFLELNNDNFVKVILRKPYRFARKVWHGLEIIVRRGPREFTKIFLKKVLARLYGGDAIPVSSGFSEYYNANLANNYAEHQVIVNSDKVYWHSDELKTHYVRGDGDPRVMAIYLPQFHPFKENDQAWGRGFTEWTNVTASTPRFVGQEQPVFPSDLGFYDLRNPQIIHEQIGLAKKYGVYGFQFYYYWFSGKKVMEMPIDIFLEHKDWDFHFSICWANENWTRKWDGSDDEVIFEQKNRESDPLQFIKDVAKYLNDSRYVTENGKPILTVYRVDLLDDAKKYARIWREYFKKEYDKELWLIACTNFANFDVSDIGFDATMDFTPTNSTVPAIKNYVSEKGKFIDVSNKLIDANWSGYCVDYRHIAKTEMENIAKNSNTYKTISPSWCNEARRKGKGGVTFFKSSPELYAKWLDTILDYETNIKKKSMPIVFINAWNEWAESAMLEPSQQLGHNTLIRTAEVIAKYSQNPRNKINFPEYGIIRSGNAKIAVIVHLYYLDSWKLLSEKLRNLDRSFDLFISTRPEYVDTFYPERISQYHKNTTVIPVPNHGRDVLPFVMIAQRIRNAGYENCLKLHSKKSKHRDDGQEWAKDIYASLLPEDTKELVVALDDSEMGIIGPKRHIVSLSKHMGGDERALRSLMANIFSAKEVDNIIKHSEMYPYFGGTMFWCRMNYLDPLSDMFLIPSDFEIEMGQIDGTLAHAVERLLGKIVCEKNGKKMKSIDTLGRVEDVADKYDQEYKFAS
ncbi:MAG: glycoside hydrolase family 99-like domain-containing protein [Candidatus Nomurabacteria bacterium]|jgi:lipopolysaccharide biosynthesis protein|nr:glycoside hydrolase family 99-like domain-containing protein [Candidatus Nomurabacteria bacterium]